MLPRFIALLIMIIVFQAGVQVPERVSFVKKTSENKKKISGKYL